jgi:anti-anti-sigma factor
MELHVSHEDGYILATTDGLIDETTGGLFREYLYPLVRQKGTKVVLDLSKSPRIDSSGLGALVQLVVNANTNNSQVVLAATTLFVSTVFARSKLDKFFDQAESVSEAISQLSE